MYVLGAPAPSRLNVGLGEADIALSPSGERIAKLAPSGASDAWRGEIPLTTPANQQAGKPPYLSPEGERATSHNVRFRSLPERRLVEGEIGRAHVCTPVTNAHLVCRLMLE